MTTTTNEPTSSIQDIMNLQGSSYEDYMPEETSKIELITVQEMGKTVEVILEPGMTVKDALEAAEIDPSGYSLRLNGAEPVSLNHYLDPGDSVILAREIRGA